MGVESSVLSGDNPDAVSNVAEQLDLPIVATNNVHYARREMARAQDMGVDSFPALVLDCSGSRWRIPVEYRDPAAMLETIGLLL